MNDTKQRHNFGSMQLSWFCCQRVKDVVQIL